MNTTALGAGQMYTMCTLVDRACVDALDALDGASVTDIADVAAIE